MIIKAGEDQSETNEFNVGLTAGSICSPLSFSFYGIDMFQNYVGRTFKNSNDSTQITNENTPVKVNDLMATDCD